MHPSTENSTSGGGDFNQYLFDAGVCCSIFKVMGLESPILDNDTSITVNNGETESAFPAFE